MSGHTGATLRLGLVDAVRSSGDLTDVQIETAFPGDAVKAESVYAGEVLTEFERVAFNETSGRMNVLQVSRIPLEVRVASRRTADDTTARLGEVMDAVREVILNGEVFADDADVVSVDLAETSDFTLGTPQGYLGQALFTVSIRTQIP